MSFGGSNLNQMISDGGPNMDDNRNSRGSLNVVE